MILYRNFSMSHGPGHVQRAILDLIDGDPDGAWTTTEICQHVYAVDLVEKKHRVAVIRVLRRLKGWSYSHRPGHEGVLWTKYSHESCLKACWLCDHTHMTFEAFLHTEVAKEVQRQRDEATRGGKAEFELVSMTSCGVSCLAARGRPLGEVTAPLALSRRDRPSLAKTRHA